MYILHPFTILDPPLLHVCLIDMKFLVSKEPSFCVSSVMLSCCVLVYSYLTAWGLYSLYSDKNCSRKQHEQSRTALFCKYVMLHQIVDGTSTTTITEKMKNLNVTIDLAS